MYLFKQEKKYQKKITRSLQANNYGIKIQITYNFNFRKKKCHDESVCQPIYLLCITLCNESHVFVISF